MIKALQNSLGVLTDDPEELKALVHYFYKTLYTSEGVSNMEEVLNTVPMKVSAEMNELLGALYTTKEVKAALFQMYPTKSPGLDGFLAHFYQRHWDLCGPEVTEAVLMIVRGEDSPECINDTVLVLIPKGNESNFIIRVQAYQLM